MTDCAHHRSVSSCWLVLLALQAAQAHADPVWLDVGTLPVATLPVESALPTWSWPVSGTVSSLYGPRWERTHHGIDIAAPVGAPVAAARPGKVLQAGERGGYGLCVELLHADGETSRYAHLSQIGVVVGEQLLQGQALGRVGQTGHATGPHLHFEVRAADGSPLDPAAVVGP